MLRAACLLAMLCLVAGCGYMVGPAYSPNVRTVHVPLFENQLYRREIEFQLTEAVCKQIESQTSLRLAPMEYADTVLIGRIVDFDKNVLSETASDFPRELQVRMAVEVTWTDRRTGDLLAQQVVPIEPDVIQAVTMSDFAPEVGQSLATARQELVTRMARDIVQMMEAPW